MLKPSANTVICSECYAWLEDSGVLPAKITFFGMNEHHKKFYMLIYIKVACLFCFYFFITRLRLMQRILKIYAKVILI